MTKYLVRRLIQLPVVLFFISLIVFSLMHITPGDPAELMLGDFYTAEDAAHLRHNLGLDRPLHVQYLTWIWGAVRFDLGNSFYTLRPISEMILDRAPFTITLTFLAMAVALLIAIPIGIIAAHRHNTIVDYMSMVGAMMGISIPNFALAVLLILVLAVWLDLLPISGPGDPLADPIGSIPFYVMPVAALSTARVALFSRLLRSSMLDILNQDYIRTARAKGLHTDDVVYRHALRNALLPFVTMFGLMLPELISGAVIIEQIFAWPGIGRLSFDAILARDYPVVLTVTLIAAVITLAGTFLSDILYAVVDPRIRLS